MSYIYKIMWYKINSLFLTFYMSIFIDTKLAHGSLMCHTNCV